MATEGVEVKSGIAAAKHLALGSIQREFDGLISASNPATAVLDGQRLTITSVRLDGEARQYAIGRPDGDTAQVDVRRGDSVMHVPAGEVFTASEAGDLYWHYFQTGTVPDAYVWRLLDV
jgi:hypothetical protein